MSLDHPRGAFLRGGQADTRLQVVTAVWSPAGVMQTGGEWTEHLAMQLDAAEAGRLCDVLTALDDQVRDALGPNLVGVYLKGSFALGWGDEHADVDFLVVVRTPLGPGEEARIRAVHRALPGREEHWAHVLEGSYAPLAQLGERPAGSPWLYVDNGQREMEYSTHDNTEVFRWVLKHHGMAVSGPPAGSLLADVPLQLLREEAGRLALHRRDSALGDREYLENGWGQPHEVLTSCRMLYTAMTGTVTGKVPAARWCLGVVPSTWHPLIESAIASRPDPWKRVHQRAVPELTAQTAPFIDFMATQVVGAVGRPAEAAHP